MSLGLHIALTDEELEKLLACTSDDERTDLLHEEIEEKWDWENEKAEESRFQPTDKAWDAIHRCLGDFPPNTPWFYEVDPEQGAWAKPEEHGSYPLRLAVLGGRRLNEDESDHILRLIEAKEVADIAAAMQPIDEAWMRERYFRNCEGAWPEYGDDDFAYTWEWFQALRAFFRRVAPTGAAVLFSAPQ